MKKRYTIAAAVLILIVSVSIIFGFKYRTDKFIMNEDITRIESYAITNLSNLNNMIDRRFDLLSYIANTERIRNTPAQDIITETNVPGFLRIYVYREDGNGYCNKKFLGNFADSEFFKAVMSGQNYVYVDSFSGEDEFIFCVPIKGDYGRNLGVIAGVCSSADVYNSLTFDPGKNEKFYIYDKLGRLIMKDPSVNVNTKNSKNASDKAFADMKEGKNGLHRFVSDNITYNVSYKQLDYNNWYLFTIAAENKGMNKLANKIIVTLVLQLAILLALIVIYFTFERKEYNKQLARVRDETTLLAKTIPGSTIMCRLDDLLTIKYASEVMYSKLGYVVGSDKDVSLGLREIIHPDDLKGFNYLYDEYKNTDSRFEYNCRFICKNGKPRWMSCFMRFVNNVNNVRNLYLVAVDISEQKEAERRLKISEERYKVVIDQSNSVVFEYNMRSHDYFITNNFYEMFNVNANVGDVIAVFMKQHRIHSDDRIKFEKMIGELYNRCGYREAELRIMDASKKYAWYSMKVTSLSDDGIIPVRIIGNINNIDSEKRNLVNLLNDAKMDTLTGCYNRESSLELTKRMIENETGDSLSAVILVDVDHFRQINERYGHEMGDEILKQTSRILKNQLRMTDVIGRVDDDEFMLLIRGCTTMEQITSKLEAMVEGARNIEIGDCKEVSYSIGVAIYPTHSRDYYDLYDMADKAVYISKTTGYDQYTIYDPSM